MSFSHIKIIRIMRRCYFYCTGTKFWINKRIIYYRKFSLDQITRDDVWSANRETEAETGITYITDAQDESAKKILAG